MHHHTRFLGFLLILWCFAFEFAPPLNSGESHFQERGRISLSALESYEAHLASVPQQTTMVAKDLSRIIGTYPLEERTIKAHLPCWLVSAFRKPSFSTPAARTLFCIWQI